MGRNKHRSQLDSVNGINVTPMVDLLFVLLIVFIISTPTTENAMSVSPPEMSSDTIKEDNSKIVNLDKHGKIIYEQKEMTLNELSQKLIMLSKSNPKINILLRSDGTQTYSKVIEVMKAVKNAGFKNVSLVTEAEKK